MIVFIFHTVIIFFLGRLIYQMSENSDKKHHQTKIY